MKHCIILIITIFTAIPFNTTAQEINVAYKYNISVEYFGSIELVSIFTRKETRWPTGERIIVYIKPKNSFEHNVFTSLVLGMTTYRYKQMLTKRVYEGGISPPITKHTDEEMIESIKNTEYSIGYINYGLAVLNVGGHNIRFIKLP